MDGRLRHLQVDREQSGYGLGCQLALGQARLDQLDQLLAAGVSLAADAEREHLRVVDEVLGGGGQGPMGNGEAKGCLLRARGSQSL